MGDMSVCLSVRLSIYPSVCLSQTKTGVLVLSSTTLMLHFYIFSFERNLSICYFRRQARQHSRQLLLFLWFAYNRHKRLQ